MQLVSVQFLWMPRSIYRGYICILLIPSCSSFSVIHKWVDGKCGGGGKERHLPSQTNRFSPIFFNKKHMFFTMVCPVAPHPAPAQPFRLSQALDKKDGKNVSQIFPMSRGNL